eukprot:306218_1
MRTSLITQDIKNKLLTSEMVPLHQFTTADICNVIQNWVFTDIEHTKYLQQIKNIFRRSELSGSKICMYGTNDVQKMVENELLQFMTRETITISFDQLREFIQENPKLAESQTAEQIATMIYNFPVHNLTNVLQQKNIDGVELIKDINNKQNKTIIARETGWDEQNVYQIQQSLLKFNSFTQETWNKTMKEISEHKEETSLSKSVINEIRHVIDSCDIELLVYQIKNGKRGKIVQAFSNDLMEKVEDLMKNNEHDGFVEQVYEFVAKCFLSKNELGLNEWICGNCGNENFGKYIGGELRNNPQNCSLCSLKQKDSIVLILKNHDTYTMVKNEAIEFHEKTKNEQKDDSNIDKTIQEVLENKDDDWKLFCRDLISQQTCPSVLRLSKYLLQYKEALQKIEDTNINDIQNTIQRNIDKYVNNEIFCKLFMKCVNKQAKITQKDVNLLKTNSISMDKDVFLKFSRKEFCIEMQKTSQNRIKRTTSSRLYKDVMKSLKKKACFDDFLADINMDDVEYDWQHILDFHVSAQHGDPITIENIFRFFDKVIHYEDTPTEKEKCISKINHQKRIQTNTEKRIQFNSGDKNHNFEDDKKLFEIKQDYMQHMLDKIHCFLAHSDFQQYLNRYFEQCKEQTDEKDEKQSKPIRVNLSSHPTLNKSKYITEIPESANTQIMSYGFGINHSHPYLTPKYNSIHNEILFNSLCCLLPTQFITELVKAIRHHQTEINKKNGHLKCRYYDEKYNILRNDSIGVRHIL